MPLITLMGCSSDDKAPPLDGGGRDDASRADQTSPPEASGDDAATGLDALPDVVRDGGTIVVNRPELVPATDERIATLRVPIGFRLSVVARDLMGPRMLAVGPDRSVYVTSPMTSQVWRLRDENGDGDASDPNELTVVASAADAPDLAGVHGIAISGDSMYLASVKSVYVATLAAGQLTGLRRIVSDLPDGGQHPNRTIGIGPDGKLYISVGSDCNACAETNTEHAALLRVELDGTPSANSTNPAHPVLARTPSAMVSPRVFASGLRNTLGFDWHPITGELWGSDHGSDGLGNDVPFDELNRLVGGRSYGWPYCWGDRQVDPVVDQPSMDLSKEAYCPTTEPMVLGYPAHSAPIAFSFYYGAQFPAEFSGDAFAAFRGSWNRAVPTGYKVVRIHFEDGAPSPRAGLTTPVEDFLTGFLIDDRHQFGRLAGLAVDADGSLLVSEDSNGFIYRVSFAPNEPDAAPPGDGGDGG